jgi:hypothetical protein
MEGVCEGFVGNKILPEGSLLGIIVGNGFETVVGAKVFRKVDVGIDALLGRFELVGKVVAIDNGVIVVIITMGAVGATTATGANVAIGQGTTTGDNKNGPIVGDCGDHIVIGAGVSIVRAGDGEGFVRCTGGEVFG